ncbi:hypothetical protein CALVIDRAFT_564123 [Calocera viscosa TUFC12733]|uniref:Pentatricopeptide repeat-containing protein-mitochondrial domain-containing protein n=1 Tax=Calocera viscosa (strain TUFC12733) TaxID=1330018 RepID=A0A167M1K6_CALVF|nr:hypothetical protein CALVIDRAFT_564123 [Calocera viscosa TUFC12733]
MWTRCERAKLFLDFLVPRLHAIPASPPFGQARVVRSSHICTGAPRRAPRSGTRASSSSAPAHPQGEGDGRPTARSELRQPSTQDANARRKAKRSDFTAPTRLAEIHGEYEYNVPLRMPYAGDVLARQTTATQEVFEGKWRARKARGRASGFDAWHTAAPKDRPAEQTTPEDTATPEPPEAQQGDSQALTDLRLQLLQPTLPPDFLLRLRPLAHAITPRDVGDITRFLCTPAKLVGSFPTPSGIPWPASVGKEGDMPGAEVELELALLCMRRSPAHHAQALRAVMLRHLGQGPEGHHMLQRCWDELVRTRSRRGYVDRLTGHNIGELVTIYLALLAGRAVGTYQTRDGQERPLPASLEIPFFRDALELGVRIGRGSRAGHLEVRARPGQPLTPSLGKALLLPYLTTPVLGTLLNWLAAIQFARMAHDSKKLYMYISVLTRNKNAAEVWELWERVEEGVRGGWAMFVGGQKGEAPGIRYWDKEQTEEVGFGEHRYEEEEHDEKEEDEEENLDEGDDELQKLESEVRALEGELQSLEADTATPAPVEEKRAPSSVIPIRIVTPVQTAFLSSFLMLHRPDLTTMILTYLISAKIKLTTHHFSALLSGFAKRGSLNEAQQTWKMMGEQNVERDRASWNAYLQALFGGKQWRDGMMEFAKMREAFPEPEKRPEPVKDQDKSGVKQHDKREQGVGTQVWNTVLHGLFLNDRTEEARLLWREMHRLGMVDVVSYNTALKFQARKDDWVGIARSLRALEQDGIRPDAYTFTTILEVTASRTTKGQDRIDSVRNAVHLVWGVMKKHGVRANGVMIGKIVDSMVNGGREENVRAAIALLQEIEQSESGEILFPGSGPSDQNPSPLMKDIPIEESASRLNEITYTACIVGIMRSTLDGPVKRTLAAQLLQRMRARNIGANRVTYHVLLRACFDTGAAAEGMSLWREQRAMGFANRDTWYLVLRGLIDLDPNFDSSRVPQAVSVDQYFPDQASLLPSGELRVPDGNREDWIKEVATALEDEGVWLDGSLRTMWNRLMASRGHYNAIQAAFN